MPTAAATASAVRPDAEIATTSVSRPPGDPPEAEASSACASRPAARSRAAASSAANRDDPIPVSRQVGRARAPSGISRIATACACTTRGELVRRRLDVLEQRPGAIALRHAGSPWVISQRMPPCGAHSQSGSTVAAYTNS